jgi:N-hydroxyarylamine O-acetyltransferase
MDIKTYLERLHYTGSLQPDANTLNGLHQAHMVRIPFENLDIALKRPIQLNDSALWEKIITHKRGGFCYELNGLFAWLLKQIGFEVTCLNARVFDADGNLGIEFDHLALLVQAPGESERWLADVGFGDSFNQPLNLDERNEQTQGLRAYRVDQTAAGTITWQRNYAGAWERLYFFDPVPHDFPGEYEAACLYHQNSPESPFTRKSIISRATPEGRVSLEAGYLILTQNGQTNRAEARK